MIKYVAVFAAIMAVSISAMAQDPSIVGTWILINAEKMLPDGSRVPDYGPNPHGQAIFTEDGYYSVQVYRSERLKFSSGDKFKGTLEEYKDASVSTSVHFGRYSVDSAKHTITFRIDRSSIPNLDNTTAVRAYELKDDELSWKVAPRSDGSVPITTLRRAK
jgi:Lipocalin-like domain